MHALTCHTLLYSDRVSHSLYTLFFFNDTATTEIYPLSLHDALPIFVAHGRAVAGEIRRLFAATALHRGAAERSEEHTSQLQSPDHLVFQLLLEKTNKIKKLTIRRRGGIPDNCTNFTVVEAATLLRWG